MDMDLTPIIASFTLFSLMEFGDKTHIAVITLATRNRAFDVFVGALAAFAIVDGVSVVFGGFIAYLVPPFWINIAAGCFFLAFGVINLINSDEYDSLETRIGGSVVSAFSLVSLTELGDKTQFASIALAAKYGNPLIVLLGIVLASIVLTGSGIIVGQGLLRFVPRRYLRYIASGLFLFFGTIFLFSAFFNVTIL
jgi:putative Ca2+/H+ antiporter (TMEM165/GDT1 family)